MSQRTMICAHEAGKNMKVEVRNNDVAQAMRVLKRKLQKEGVFNDMRRTVAYEKPSEKRKREAQQGVRRARKAEQKRIEREGY
jgi:small subunit ribosomal protein S21